VHIVADRFVVDDDDTAEDLATGSAVRLRMLSPAGALDEALWVERCAALCGVGDPHIDRLIDYGVVDAGRRFEALATPSAGRASGRRRRSDRRRRGSVSNVADTQSLDLQLVELLEGGHRAGTRSMMMRATSASNLEAAWTRAARLGRLHGYVPLSASVLSRYPLVADWVRCRHVLLFQRGPLSESGHDRAIRLMLALGRASRRPHVVLFLEVAADGVGKTAVAWLEPVDLWGAVSTVSRPSLWATGGGPLVASEPISAAVTVEECRPSYRPRHEPLESTRMAGAVARGLEAARSGRHALGHRRLRQAIAGLDRRGDRERAANAALSLGQLLLIRGRAKAAVVAFDGACRRFDASGRTGQAAVAQAYLGLALTDEARLSDAEAVLRSVLLVARDDDRGELRRCAPVALARCLLWQGRLHETRALLEASDGRQSTNDPARLRVLARLALASGDLASAGRLAWLALGSADGSGCPIDIGRCHSLVADVEGRAGNTQGLRRHVELGLRAARRAHARADVWRLRGTLLEGLVRIGGPRAGRAVGLRMARRGVTECSTLLRARLCRALVAALPQERDANAWRQFVRGVAVGRGAAALHPPHHQEPRMDIISELVEVLGICQDMEDEPARLMAVCDAVKARLGGLSVALVGGASQAQVVLAESGRARSGRSEIAARIIDTGLVIPPARLDAGVEAGAPVRYGGDVVAALVCRWAPDQAPDASRADALLATAAAACAPSVRSHLDRLTMPCPDAQPDDLGIVGVSQAAEEMRAAARRAAAAPFPVVIAGESGSGKEVIARAIHRWGVRRHRRLAALNCAALNDELIEAELFGHTRGAFSGAMHERIGVLEDADGGTLFLDEVSELSARAQAKLLRTLQEGEIRRVGENLARRVDVRLVTATNRDLWADVEAGRFRRDLLYRLDVIRIAVPPLRDRIEDIALLASHFWSQSTHRIGSRATLTPDLLGALARHDWPGNVRELQNVMAALAVEAPPRGRVGCARLGDALTRVGGDRSGTEPTRTLEQARHVFERRFVRAALAREGGHQARAASALGLTRQGLAKLLARLELTAGSGGRARGG